MKMFELPTIEIQMFAVEDVITTSTGGSTGGNGGNGTNDDEL